MLKKFALPLMLICFIIGNTSAQKLKVVSGKLKSLAPYKSFNMEYEYEDGLTIGKKTEKEYVDEKVTEKNEKEPGSGDAWAKKWNENKEGGLFFQKLETLFNEVLKSKGVEGKRNNASAPCTIKFKVYYLDPGFNVGVARRPAYVSMKATFIADGKEIAVVDLEKAPGAGAGGYDFDAAYRLSEGFEKTGKTLGKTLAKEVY